MQGVRLCLCFGREGALFSLPPTLHLDDPHAGKRSSRRVSPRAPPPRLEGPEMGGQSATVPPIEICRLKSSSCVTECSVRGARGPSQDYGIDN